jgi:hypothetical protein
MKGFDKLDIDSKSIVLHFEAQVMASVRYYNYRVTLFYFEDKLVEEYYDTETKEISRICSAQSSDLNKYLRQFDISDLLSSAC